MIRAILITTLLAIASSMALTDEASEASEYASMVCAGHWPDYQSIQPECDE
jgi:hypothetical protein